MALSNAAIRAIASRRKAANDNETSPRRRTAARVMSTAMLQACLASAGFSEHQER